MTKRLLLVAAVAVLAITTNGGLANAGSLNILQYGQTNAQTQLDVNHSYFWDFTYTGSTAYSPITATFQMKRGPKTSENAIMELWAADSVTGANIGGSALATATLTPNAFSQSFSQVQFVLFSSPTVLPARFNVTLKSNALDEQAKAYFIKGRLQDATFTFQDGSGNTIPDFYYQGFGNGSNGGTPSPPVPVAVPEPSSYLAQAGLVLAAAMFRRFRRKSIAA